MSETHLAERLMYPLPDGWQDDPEHVAALKDIWPKVIAKNKELIDAEIASLRAQLDEAKADRDAYKRDAARALEQLGKGLDDQIDTVRASAIEDAAKIAEGWPAHAAGDDYQTSGNGNFWDAGNEYDQARIDAASEIRALLSESKT